MAVQVNAREAAFDRLGMYMGSTVIKTDPLTVEALCARVLLRLSSSRHSIELNEDHWRRRTQCQAVPGCNEYLLPYQLEQLG